MTLHYSHAQNFRAQIILGLNASQIEGDAIKGYNQPGILAGAGVEFPLNNGFSLQPEMRFSQKGSRNSKRDLVFLIWRLNYLEVPLFLNYRIKDVFLIQLGASVNYLINAKLDDGFGFVPKNDAIRTLDYNVQAGLGYEFADSFILHAGFSYSIRNVAQFEGYINNTLSLSLRYVFLSQRERN